MTGSEAILNLKIRRRESGGWPADGPGRFLDKPFLAAVRVAMAVRGEKPAAVSEKQRPDLLAVGFGQAEAREVGQWNELEAALPVGLRKILQGRPDFKKKHQPVRAPLVAMLAHQTGQPQIAWGQVRAQSPRGLRGRRTRKGDSPLAVFNFPPGGLQSRGSAPCSVPAGGLPARLNA